MAQPDARGIDSLVVAAWVYLAANLLHGADHVRQHFAGLNVEITASGAVLTLAAAAVVFLAVRRHPRAPLAATLVGFISGALVVSSHVVPHWSLFSDSYIDDIHPDAGSWVVVAVEIGSAFALGAVGALHLMSRRVRPDALSRGGAR